MSALTYRPALLTVITTVLAVAACSAGGTATAGGATATTSRHASRKIDECTRPHGSRLVSVHTKHLPKPTRVLLIGTGPVAVVLSNQSDRDLCAWMGFAHTLASSGFTAVLYDGTDPVHEITAIAGHLRRHGYRAVTAVGASQGAKASLIAAARTRPHLDALVSLSAEARLSAYPYINLKHEARKLRLPTLFVTAANDPYGATMATRAYHRLAPARSNRLEVVHGNAHGIDLLKDQRTEQSVVRFLRHHTGT